MGVSQNVFVAVRIYTGNVLRDDRARVGHAEDTYPMQGFCRTPMILWILSMATLSWKLLSPGKEASCTMSNMTCVDCRDESVKHMGCAKCETDSLASVVRKGLVKIKSLNLTKIPN